MDGPLAVLATAPPSFAFGAPGVAPYQMFLFYL
jgi:hypothetical protein